MATAKTRHKGWLSYLFVGVLAVGGGAYFYHGTIAGYGAAGTAYGAKNACSCRYLAGRGLDSCEEDFVPGMEAVFLSDDEDERAVTAYIPLIASNTARYREGFGCVLDGWDGA
ncbi:hypothetical protein GCM10009127_00880 [Alteraurantiacibacter aestuarii]|uniref:Amidase n=1 Tax=Alteraurantiacibacter aestuarii TaxID=650004 RepID=A0A844ZNL7_9SPHN|nr:hypothetical protein [Alteraurantiacibacter aestuarii]MXO88656.1 hypothetical protein [Alteraurantiacibacter aestuarii]